MNALFVVCGFVLLCEPNVTCCALLNACQSGKTFHLQAGEF